MGELKKTYVSSSSLLDLYDALISLEVISPDINVGINRHDLLDIEKRIPASMQSNLWDIAKKSNCPDHIGLLVGTQINNNAKGVLSHLITYSNNLRDALSLHEKYISVMSENEALKLENKEWGCRIYIESGYDQLSNIHAVERSLGGILTWGRHLANKSFFPIKVSVKHKKPSYTDEYTKIFGNNVCYSQDSVYMDISNEVLNLVNSTSNSYMRAILKKHIDSFIDNIKTIDSLPIKVEKVITLNLHSGNFSSDNIANILSMSRQTLHRKLKKENTSFRQILENIRKEKAVDYLENSEVHLDKVSDFLGFKETSAFHRAFKAWFNHSPGYFRKQLIKNSININ